MPSPSNAPPSLPAPGDRVGKYVVVRLLGEGGMGVVYEAEHQRIGQRVAIKMLQLRAAMSPEIVARFEREARAAGQLRSRHAARVLDVDQTESGLPYLVMELLEGRDLAAELTERKSLPVPEAVDIVLQACAAMAEAHARGIVHRDLKPSNLFLCDDGPRRLVKVLDFGISKITSDNEVSVTATAATVGTPLYMSPEQVRSAKTVDARSDVWSLGVLLYEMIAGALPFDATSAVAVAAAIVADAPKPLAEVRPDVPSEVAAAVHKALAKDPAARFSDVRAMAEALAPFAATPSVFAELDAVSGPRTRVSSSPGVEPTASLVNAETLLVSDADAKAQGEAVRTTLGWTQREKPAPKRSPMVVAGVAALGATAILGVAVAVVAARGPKPAASAASTTVTAPIAATTTTATATTTTTATATATESASAPEPPPTASASARVVSRTIAPHPTAPPPATTTPPPNPKPPSSPTAAPTNPNRL